MILLFKCRDVQFRSLARLLYSTLSRSHSQNIVVGQSKVGFHKPIKDSQAKISFYTTDLFAQWGAVCSSSSGAKPVNNLGLRSSVEALAMSCFWSKHFDPSSRKYYYHDSDTQATAWELPAGSFAADSAPQPQPGVGTEIRAPSLDARVSSACHTHPRMPGAQLKPPIVLGRESDAGTGRVGMAVPFVVPPPPWKGVRLTPQRRLQRRGPSGS
jgi:hypothetical protein